MYSCPSQPTRSKESRAWFRSCRRLFRCMHLHADTTTGTVASVGSNCPSNGCKVQMTSSGCRRGTSAPLLKLAVSGHGEVELFWNSPPEQWAAVGWPTQSIGINDVLPTTTSRDSYLCARQNLKMTVLAHSNLSLAWTTAIHSSATRFATRCRWLAARP